MVSIYKDKKQICQSVMHLVLGSLLLDYFTGFNFQFNFEISPLETDLASARSSLCPVTRSNLWQKSSFSFLQLKGTVHNQRRCTNNQEMALSLTDKQDRWRCWQSQCHMDIPERSLVPEGQAEARPGHRAEVTYIGQRLDRVTEQRLHTSGRG